MKILVREMYPYGTKKMEENGISDIELDSTIIPLTVRLRQPSASFAIEQQYALNNQGLTVFEKCYRSKMWVVCYQIGRTFLEAALFEIPTHGYYNCERHKNERLQNSFDSLRVADLLLMILKLISDDERDKIIPKYPPNTNSFFSAPSSPRLESEAHYLYDRATEMADPETLLNYQLIREELLQQSDEDCCHDDIQQALEALFLCGFFPNDISPSTLNTDSTQLKNSTSLSSLNFSNIYPSLDDIAQSYPENLETG
jgi:hypothetical protein